jgi:hypothetical protein
LAGERHEQPTDHTALVVIDPQEGSDDKKKIEHEVGAPYEGH